MRITETGNAVKEKEYMLGLIVRIEKDPSRKGSEVTVISPAGYQSVSVTGPAFFSCVPPAERMNAGKRRRHTTRNLRFIGTSSYSVILLV